MNNDLINELKQNITSGKILINEPLSRHTTYKIGGLAEFFVVPKGKDEFVSTIKICRENGVEFFVLGKGSNVLASDEGFRGVVINAATDFADIRVDGDEIYAEAGAGLINVSYKAYENSLEGMEFACGVPGTLGGAIYMNAGCYGGEMKGVISEVELLDDKGNIVVFNNEEMRFDYRYSILRENEYIVLSAKLKLKKGNKESIGEIREKFKVHRQNGQPLDMPNAGSVFKRPDGYFPGKLIEDLGLKGYTIGGAQVSEKHANFIVNIGDATAKDVVSLIHYVQNQVYINYGIMMETEIKMLGDIATIDMGTQLRAII